MLKSRSSIFSFETLDLSESGFGAWRAIGLAILLVALAEFGARVAVAPLNDDWLFWNRVAAAKFRHYESLLEQRRPPLILMVGDSTAARDFSPADFDRALGMEEVSYNLGCPANFPLSFDASVTRLLLDRPGPHPQYLLVSFSPGAFSSDARTERFEESILQSPIVREANGEIVYKRYIALARLQNVRHDLLLRLHGKIRKRSSPPERGFEPFREVDFEKPADGVRAVRRWVDPKRIEALENCFRVAVAHGIRPILVIPPVSVQFLSQWDDPQAYHNAVAPLCDKYGVALWDYNSRDYGFEDELPDAVHLSEAGARRFSGLLGRRFKSEYEKPLPPGANQ